jgi:RNase P protein component
MPEAVKVGAHARNRRKRRIRKPSQERSLLVGESFFYIFSTMADELEAISGQLSAEQILEFENVFLMCVSGLLVSPLQPLPT